MISKLTRRASSKPVSRRSFLIAGAAAGGGLAIGVQVPGIGKALAQKVPGADSNEIGAWVVIRSNDDVIVRIARSEMGQGTLTGLAQLVCDELQCDWKKVKAEYVLPGQSLARNRIWGDMSTGGSRGIRTSHDYVRKGGAAAREMLIKAAADGWKVPVAECTVENGVITHAKSGRKTTYGKVAQAAAKLEVPKEPKIRDPKDWKLIGKGVPRLDTEDKLNGKLVYAIDVKVPGMLLASIMDAPVFGAKLKSVDDAKAKAMPGVKHVLRVGDSAVAVVAETWWQANQALKEVKITWTETENDKVSTDSIKAFLAEGLTAKDGVFVGNKAGNADEALAGAAKKLEATYYSPFQNHVCMEPMNCTARVTADKCEVWVATQSAEASLATAAAAAGLEASKCEVYRLHLGGGFGRRGAFQDYVTKGVLLAKQLPGIPVKTIWSREEDMRQGRHKPIGLCKMEAGLDDKGDLVALKMRISAPSILQYVAPQRLSKDGSDPVAFQGLFPGGAEGTFGYTIPNLLIEHAMRATHVPPGFWRGVNNNQNAIWMETFLDEVAKAAGKDPLEFRRAMMTKHPKHLAVLNAVAEKIGWGKPAAPGVSRGIAQMMGFGSYVAGAAEVTISDKGKLKIERLVMATDCGYVVNPQQVTAQVEGSVAYGLGALLHQAITIRNGRVEQENFDTYPMVLMEDFPKIETILAPSGGFWGGVGEPTICVAAPAVLNAIYAATGKPMYTRPLAGVKFEKA